MKNLFIGVVAACVVATAIVSPSFAAVAKAGHAKTGATKMAKTLKCPACGMPMGMKASKGATVAVKIKNATYYCCAACPAGQAALKNAKGAKAHKASTMKM